MDFENFEIKNTKVTNCDTLWTENHTSPYNSK